MLLFGRSLVLTMESFSPRTYSKHSRWVQEVSTLPRVDLVLKVIFEWQRLVILRELITLKS